jgi:uncharacterized iron-regulated membrane protein
MKDFVSQYSAHRFALDRQDRRRRGQHGVVASLLLAAWNVLKIAILLPVVAAQLLVVATRDLRAASNDPSYRGTFFAGRPQNRKQP